jgi:hypothetical protein
VWGGRFVRWRKKAKGKGEGEAVLTIMDRERRIENKEWKDVEMW